MEEEELSFEVVFQFSQDQINQWQEQFSCKITFDSSQYRSACFSQTILQSYEILGVSREVQEFEEVYSQIFASIQTAKADQYEDIPSWKGRILENKIYCINKKLQVNKSNKNQFIKKKNLGNTMMKEWKYRQTGRRLVRKITRPIKNQIRVFKNTRQYCPQCSNDSFSFILICKIHEYGEKKQKDIQKHL